MKGTQTGFMTLLQSFLDRNLLTFNFILDHETLSSKTLFPECMEMMNLVIQIANRITEKG